MFTRPIPPLRNVLIFAFGTVLTLAVQHATERASTRLTPHQTIPPSPQALPTPEPLVAPPPVRSIVPDVAISDPRLESHESHDARTGMATPFQLLTFTVRNDTPRPIRVLILGGGNHVWTFGEDVPDSPNVVEAHDSAEYEVNTGGLDSTDTVELRAVIYTDGTAAGSAQQIQDYYRDREHSVNASPRGGAQ